MQSTCLEHAVESGETLMTVVKRGISAVTVVEERFSTKRTSPRLCGDGPLECRGWRKLPL